MVCLPAVSGTDRYPVAGDEAVYDAAQKYRGWQPERIKDAYILGWIMGQIAVEGTRVAIEKVGIENLSGRAVRDALASLNGFDGGLLPPVTMSDSHPYYTEGLRIYTYEAGKLKLLSDKWYKWAPVFSFETGTYPK